MAFMGIIFSGVMLILIVVGFLIDLAMLVIATVLVTRKKYRVLAIALYVAALLPYVVVIIKIMAAGKGLGYYEAETSSGETVAISIHDVYEMKELIVNGDMDGLDELLDKSPDLIYYQDQNHKTLLEYGLCTYNVDIMEIAVDHGAVFDDKAAFKRLIYDHSLEFFFRSDYWQFAYISDNKPESKIEAGAATDEMIEAARFAIRHGAQTKWEQNGHTYTFADAVELWIDSDGKRSEKDLELLRVARRG